MVLKTILHGQMTEKIAFEVRPKKGQKMQKVFFKLFFDIFPLGRSKFKRCTEIWKMDGQAALFGFDWRGCVWITSQRFGGGWV